MNDLIQNSRVDSKEKNTFGKLLFVFWFVHWFFYLWMDNSAFTTTKGFVQHTFQYLVPILSSYALRSIYRKYSVHHLSFIKIFFIALSCSIICAFLWTIFYQLIHLVLTGHIHFDNSLIEATRYVYTYILISAAYIGYKYFQDYLNQKEKAEQAILIAQKSQLEMLRYQINPHFLFNTLNSARSLVLANPPLARELLTQISEFLRYSLSEGKNATVPLIREIEAVNTYLEIEKIRFQDNLISECFIDQEVEKIDIPVFLILPLVENCIKHGMKTSIHPLKINITAKVVDESVQIEITNTGQWIEKQSNGYYSSAGIKNVEKRLENIYDGLFLFEIEKLTNHVKVVIKIRMVK